jgi:hypothetical protein
MRLRQKFSPDSLVMYLLTFALEVPVIVLRLTRRAPRGDRARRKRPLNRLSWELE